MNTKYKEVNLYTEQPVTTTAFGEYQCVRVNVTLFEAQMMIRNIVEAFDMDTEQAINTLLNDPQFV